MAVEFVRQLHQESLEKAWNARPAKDPMPKHRQDVLSRIDSALAQLKGGVINPRRGLYQTRDNFNGVRVQLKCGRRSLNIDGRDHWFVEDAATFFSYARHSVENGELDCAINDAIEGKGKGKGKVKDTGDARAKGARPVSRRRTLDLERAYHPEVVPGGETVVDQQSAPTPGRYAQRYEKLLAEGIISERAI
jgi:hypothetical protein